MTARPVSPSPFRRWLAAFSLMLAVLVPASGQAQSRIKDIADFEGIRDNMLVGYGLVVGLNGTGDSLQNSVFTKESLVGMLDRLGVNARDSSLRTKNIAAVMVTATLPPFARQGSRVAGVALEIEVDLAGHRRQLHALADAADDVRQLVLDLAGVEFGVGVGDVLRHGLEPGLAGAEARQRVRERRVQRR